MATIGGVKIVLTRKWDIKEGKLQPPCFMFANCASSYKVLTSLLFLLGFLFTGPGPG